MRQCNLFFGIVVSVFVLLLRHSFATAETEAESQAIYQKLLKASAWVVVPEKPGRIRQGTGFIVDRTRHWLITNEHVVGESRDVRVFFPKSDSNGLITKRKTYMESKGSIRGRVLAADADRDLALVELDTLPSEVGELVLAGARPNWGERLFQVGNPGTHDLWESNAGRVTGFTLITPKDKEGKQRHALGYWLLEERPAAPGYSGGPVVNAKGLVVGVTAMSTAQSQELFQVVPQLGGLLASVRAGPIPYIASTQIKPKTSPPVGWCIDVREIEDVITMVRKDPVEARRLLHPVFAADFIDRGLHVQERGRPEVALANFHKAVELDPTIPRAYICRGVAYRNLRNNGKALEDFGEAIRRDSHNAQAYRERGVVFFLKKDYGRAIADASEAIRIDPKDEKAWSLRASAYGRAGEFSKALDDFAEAMQLAPEDPKALNALAWHLATCPEGKIRDGQKALTYAQRACELSHWKSAMILDTLAAAHAECEQFSEAVQWQKKALALATKQEQTPLKSRLKLYEKKQPYRGL